MYRRRSPLLLISLVVALFIVLVVVAAKIPGPAPDEHDSQQQQADQPTQQPKSPEQVMGEVKAAAKNQKAPGPPKVSVAAPSGKAPPQDRDEEGSSNWWSNATSPKAPGK